MKLKAFKINSKGYLLSFENEAQMPVTIQTAHLPFLVYGTLELIKEAVKEIFNSDSIAFIGFQLKEKDTDRTCVYEVKTIFNGIRITGKTEDLFFGMYADEQIKLLAPHDRQKAEKFCRISDIISNHFEIEVLNNISELLAGNNEQSLF